MSVTETAAALAVPAQAGSCRTGVSLSKPNQLSYSTAGLTRPQRRVLAELPETYRPSYCRTARATNAVVSAAARPAA